MTSNINIDTLYLELYNSDLHRLEHIATYKNTYIYSRDICSIKNNTTFNFKYTLRIYEIDGFAFKVKQFKRGTWRLELYGLYQYHRNGTLKTNRVIKLILPHLKYCRIKRIDIAQDTPRRPRHIKLKSKKLVNYRGTVYHNLYNKNYFSSYSYSKTKKNRLPKQIYRTEYSFRSILRENAWSYQLRDLSKLLRRCDRFIDRLPVKAEKINGFP